MAVLATGSIGSPRALTEYMATYTPKKNNEHTRNGVYQLEQHAHDALVAVDRALEERRGAVGEAGLPRHGQLDVGVLAVLEQQRELALLLIGRVLD